MLTYIETMSSDKQIGKCSHNLAYSLHIKLNPKPENSLCVLCMRTDKLRTNMISLCRMISHIAARKEILRTYSDTSTEVYKYTAN